MAVAFDSPKLISIAIVGGGIGGLCLAVALAHKNIPVHVYEATPAFSEIGAGVGFGPNALRAMAMLDPAIFEGYKRCETTSASPSEDGRFFNFRYGMEKPSVDGMVAGELICEVRSDMKTSSVHRARFLEELVKLMPKGAASFGKRLVGIEDEGEGVLLKFSDRTEARHDAIVGCDGIKSQVRKLLLGKGNKTSEAVFSGKCCYRGLVPAGKAIKILGEDLVFNSQMCKLLFFSFFFSKPPNNARRHDDDNKSDLGNHGHVLMTPIEQGKVINVVVYLTKEDGRWDHDEWVRPATKEEMFANFHGWSEPVKNIISLIETPDIWALFDHQLPAAPYHRKGKICLLGDSAHASTPHHGAGAGMAVEDALILSRLLASIDGVDQLESAFAAYDAVRRPRSQRLVASSRKTGEVYDFEDEVIGGNMEATRHYLQHAWDWIWKEDLNRQVETAQLCLQEYSRRQTQT